VSESPWTMPEDLPREGVPAPPDTHDDDLWAQVAKAIPVWLLPPEPFATRPDGWQEVLSTPAGRFTYTQAWHRLSSERLPPAAEPAAPAPPGAGATGPAFSADETFASRTCASLGHAGREALSSFSKLGLTLHTAWVHTTWQSNTGKSAVRFVLGLLILAELYPLLRGPTGVVTWVFHTAFLLFPLAYLFRHVPSDSVEARCESCGALWLGRPLCSSCKRRVRDPEGSPAQRRAWRSV